MEANRGTIAWNAMTPVKCHGEDVLLPKGLTGLCLGAQGVQGRRAAGDPMGVYGGVLRGGFRSGVSEMHRAGQEGAKEGLRQQCRNPAFSPSNFL